MKVKITFFIFVILSTIVGGCASLEDVRHARGEGSSKLYHYPFDTVWNILPEIAQSLDLRIAKNSKEQGYILIDRQYSTIPDGEKIAIFVEELNAGRTTVEVVSRRGLGLSAFSPGWEHKILDAISARLIAEK